MKVFMNLAHRKAMAITELETIRQWGRQGPDPARSGLLTLGSAYSFERPLFTRCRATPGRARGTRRRAAGLERRSNGLRTPALLSRSSCMACGEGEIVMLGEFHRMAEQRDWMTVTIEADTSSPLRETLARPSTRWCANSSDQTLVTNSRRHCPPSKPSASK